MVNKILKVGNQIVSIGNGVVNTPNPELEVNALLDSTETSALLGAKVKKGDLLVEVEQVVDDLGEGTDGFGYFAQFFERDDRLQLWGTGYGATPKLYRYDEEGNTFTADRGGDGWTCRARRIGLRTATNSEMATINGKYVWSTGYHYNGYGDYFPDYMIEEDNGFFRFKQGPNILEKEKWGHPEPYAASYDSYRRQYDGAHIYQAEDGTVHAVYTYQVSGSIDQNAFDTDFDGKSQFKTYTIDVDTDTWTETTHDTSTIGSNLGYGSCFFEVSGSLFLGIVYGQWRLPQFGITSDHPRYPDLAHAGYTNITIYKWNSSTQNWDFHQWDSLSRESSNAYKINFQNVDSSTHVLNVARSGSTQMFCPLRYESSSGYFERWGSHDTSDATYVASYGHSKVLNVSGEYYLFCAGAAQHRYTREGNLTHGTYSNYNQTGWDSVNSSGINYPANKSWVRVMKYNSTNDKWEALSLDKQPIFDGYRLGNNNYYTTTYYIRAIDVAHYNGKYFVAVAGETYGKDSFAVYEFNPSTETMTNLRILDPIHDDLYINQLHHMDDITQGSKTYKLITFNGDPRVAVYEYDTSGSQRWELTNTPDIWNNQYMYNAVWYENSSNELYAIVGSNTTNDRIHCWYYNKDDRQLQKVSSDNFVSGVTITNTNYYAGSLIFTLSGQEYYYTAGAGPNNRHLFEIHEGASGIPYLADASVTLPTFTGGTTNYYRFAEQFVFDNKFWIGFRPYNAPYSYAQVYYWDGSSSQFSGVSVSALTHDLSAHETELNNYVGRSDQGISFFEYNGKLYMTEMQQNVLHYIISEYKPEQNTFLQIARFMDRESQWQQGTFKPVEYNNKIYFVNYQNQDRSLVSNHLLEFDGSNINSYAIRTRIDHSSNTRYHAFISPNGDFEFIWNNSYYGRGLRWARLNPAYLANKGKIYLKKRDVNHRASVFSQAIALEDGQKGDTIQIRKIIF